MINSITTYILLLCYYQGSTKHETIEEPLDLSNEDIVWLMQVPDHVHGLNMPMFPNLVRLVIGSGLDFLPVWLNNMPNLEHITLSYVSLCVP